MWKASFLVFAAGVALVAGDKGPPVATAANDQLGLTATLYIGKDAVRQQLGYDLDGYFILIKVDLTPKGDKPLAISPDDFLLRSFKDGQKSGAFAPTQIAGRDALVIGSAAGGAVMTDDRGRGWGGMDGPPHRLPGQSPGIGNAAGAPSATATVVTNTKQKKDDPLLAALRQKVLPAVQTTKPTSGLLYFSLEGKHKPKDVQLEYSGPAGKLTIQFK